MIGCSRKASSAFAEAPAWIGVTRPISIVPPEVFSDEVAATTPVRLPLAEADADRRRTA